MCSKVVLRSPIAFAHVEVQAFLMLVLDAIGVPAHLHLVEGRAAKEGVSWSYVSKCKKKTNKT